MHSPLAASSRHLDPVLHQTEAEAKRQSYMNSWRLSILLSICPWSSFLLIERWCHGPRAGWSGRSRRSKTCWRWRRHWRRRSLGEVEKGPVGVTGDQVPISGTRVRHVPVKSNVHSTPRVKETKETEVQPLSELASSITTVIRFFNDLERKLILSMFAEFLVLKKSARTFKGLFERISPVLCKRCFARTPRSYRSIAPPKERRRHVWTCPFHWRMVFVTLQSDKIDLYIYIYKKNIYIYILYLDHTCSQSHSSYGSHGQVAVHSLSFGLALGECFAFLGTNGVSWNQTTCRKWKLYGYNDYTSSLVPWT